MTSGNSIIGYSGFVGESLSRQTHFAARYRSANIASIDGQQFDVVVCCAAPAQKWIANRDPEADRENIESLIAQLSKMTCKVFILISTVDVFKTPVSVDESTRVEEEGLHPYGLHRRLLEKFVESSFPGSHLIVRLPGLVGPGLRKNIVFDLHNDNSLHAIDSRSIFQFYPMVNLWWDIRTALHAGLRLVHLTAEPLSVAEVALQGFRIPLDHAQGGAPATYDMRTQHAEVFGATGHYQYSRRESLQAIRAYAQSEPRMPRPVETKVP